MRRLILCLLFTSSALFAAEPKWIHATSAHFDLYTNESEGAAKSALQHFEAVRAYFLGATHSKDPGGQSVRIIAFHSNGDYAKVRPPEFGEAKAFARPGQPAVIVAESLKPENYEHIFREYTQLVFDEYSSSLPYWLRAGLSELYSTLKPGDTTIKLGVQPSRDYHSNGVGTVDLNTMFALDRTSLLASRRKAGTDFYTDAPASAAVLGATNAAQTTALQQSQSAMAEDYDGAVWMLTHMILFQQDYRPKFGEFVSTLGRGESTANGFRDVYGRSISQVDDDLKIYAKLPSLNAANLPFKYEKPPNPQIAPSSQQEVDRLLANLK
ncbi:MAG TPA: hypothetical protein VHA14_12870 [Bryobacteraceae bacterium]|nr:hypothetical protein [Bryobacteraceae bacterium]